MIKGVLFDIDDTVYSHNLKAVPKLTVKLINKLKEKGIKVGCCSARAVGETISIPHEVWDLFDCKILTTGAVTVVDDKYFKNYTLDKDVVRKYIDYFETNNISYYYSSINGDIYFYGDEKIITEDGQLSCAKGKILYKQYDEDDEIVNLFFFGVNEEEFEIIKNIDSNYSFTFFKNRGGIYAPYVDKGFGVLKFCEVYGLTTDEVAACGNGQSDDYMLSMAGIGIAVKDSLDYVIDAAEYVCKKSIEDGGLYDAFLDLNIIEEDKYDDIKMFFFDNDSTLFDHIGIGGVREKTYEALEKLKKNGYKICLNTSRSYEECYNIPKRLMNMMSAIILLNGAYVIKDGEVTVTYIDYEETQKLIKYCDDNNLTYRYALDNGKGCINHVDEDKQAIFTNLYDMCPIVKPYEGEKIIHLLFYATGEVREKLFELAQKESKCYVGIGGEISAQGMSKGDAMLRVGKMYGFTPNQLCGFGDGDNDMTMIKYAGLGVAMGNGYQTLKDVADYVTDTTDNEGIYNGLKHFGFID